MVKIILYIAIQTIPLILCIGGVVTEDVTTITIGIFMEICRIIQKPI